MKIIIISSLIILLCLFWPKQINTSIIFTCTTYFSKPNRLNHFMNAIDSIQEKYLIDKFIVINEYDSEDKTDYKSIINSKYPYIEFIQKNESQHGQAYSLNMILEFIKPYDLHIGWEESWIATTSFIYKAVNIMNSNLNITQLQLTPDWRDIDKNRLIYKGNYYIVKSHALYNTINHDVNLYDKLKEQYGHAIIWPLYSLRPSLNRVLHYLNLEKYNVDKNLWPIKFEYEYGVRWLKYGAIKALIEPPVAFRQNGHLSSYR